MPTKISEEPIGFTTEMVKAILDGRKTQTRRIVNWKDIARQSGCTKGRLFYSKTFNSWAVEGNGPADIALIKPRYQVGDILWVKESLYREMPACIGRYKADCNAVGGETPLIWPWKCRVLSARFMPKVAARIWLKVLSVEVELTQDISPQDCIAEGIYCDAEHGRFQYAQGKGPLTDNPKLAYRWLIESIYGPETWEKNEWRFAYKFKRIR